MNSDKLGLLSFKASVKPDKFTFASISQTWFPINPSSSPVAFQTLWTNLLHFALNNVTCRSLQFRLKIHWHIHWQCAHVIQRLRPGLQPVLRKRKFPRKRKLNCEAGTRTSVTLIWQRWNQKSVTILGTVPWHLLTERMRSVRLQYYHRYSKR